jgi:short-subunit dehydrogenase
MPLFGKRIILTGGSGGLGQLVAAELLREGADITVMSRTWIGGGDNQVRHVAVDLSTADGIAEASTVVAREQPDILVNMAGVQYFGPAENQSFEDMHDSYMVNLVTPAALCRACLPAMKRRNSGQIANIGSIFGSIPLAYFAAYSSAKAGLRAFGEALRRELAHTEVSVTYVAPRAMRTPMLSPEIRKYADLTGMNIDAPEFVAKKIVTAIKQRKKDVYIGFPERLFVRLNAVMPRLVDAAVASGDRRAMRLFTA